MTTEGLAFEQLQQALARALAANRAESGTDHVLIVLPSYSVSESLLSHYGDRVPSLEHRYLNALLIAGRIESCEILYVSTRPPDPAVVDYYLSLMPPGVRGRARRRLRLLAVDDGTPRSVASKLLARPDLLAEIRRMIGDRPALIEPWNVTDMEVGLALALGVPVNGTAPALRGLGYKGAGRRLMRQNGVPVPIGAEDVRTVDDVIEAVAGIRGERPSVQAIVIKHDDSGAGDGNAVIDLRPMREAADPDGWLRDRLGDLPDWYLADLARGGIVEERIVGDRFSSPSAQVDILPGGEVTVLATHEQVLGGDSGQVYLGCRFPADPAYAPALAEHAARVGRALAREGAIGRFSVDFVTAATGSGPWDVYALEINLRKGGTTHPYAALRNAVPGAYSPELGQWITAEGSTRVYSSSDNVVDAAWTGLTPADVIGAVARAGLQFDPDAGAGVILHMLSGLAIDGRFGLTAIAGTTEEAERMASATTDVVSQAAARAAKRSSAPGAGGI